MGSTAKEDTDDNNKESSTDIELKEWSVESG